MVLQQNKYWNQNKEHKLWRGLTTKYHYGYINPQNGGRRSIEPEQIHVAYMSESDEWSEFPTYGKSVIGSTKKDGAGGYGSNLFEVIPYDNARIAICPKQSIWSSLGGWNDNQGIKLVNHFLYSIGLGQSQDDWYYTEGKLMDIGIFAHDPHDSNIDTDLRIISSDRYSMFMDHMGGWLGMSDVYTGEDIINYISHIFSPEDFINIGYDEGWLNYINNNNESVLSHDHFGKQFWTDSECLLVMRDV